MGIEGIPGAVLLALGVGAALQAPVAPAGPAAGVDAVFANNNQPNRVCPGDGSGGFSACSNVSSDTNFSAGVALGQLDGDSHLDAVFANLNQPNRVCTGDGSGGFSGCSDVSSDANNSRGVALSDSPTPPPATCTARTDYTARAFAARKPSTRPRWRIWPTMLPAISAKTAAASSRTCASAPIWTPPAPT